MRKRGIALLLCAALLAALAGCGAPRPETDSRMPPAAASESAAPEQALPEPPRSVEASFPLLSSPFSDAGTEAMVNHNARCCALLSGTQYFCRCLYADGSCALVRYEIVDNIPRGRTRLVADCPADYLCESGGRLYYLNGEARPESVSFDGSGRREELDEPCLSLQLFGGALYCLRADGLLLRVDGGKEALLAGCAWAFVSDRGIFYTAASDGRAHLFDPAARTDVTLTAEAALSPTLVGTTLLYAADEPDGRHLRALELSDGTHRRMEAVFEGLPELLLDWDEGWQLRLTALGGAEGQQLIAVGAAFEPSPAVRNVPGEELRRCRGVHDVLHTDELLAPDGSALGFELVMPVGISTRSLAADNPPEA